MRTLASFDTEDNSRNKVLWLVFYNGVFFYNFKERTDAQRFLRTTHYEIWACNLEYDLFNLFDLDTFFDKVKFKLGDRILEARYYDNVFYDTFNHWRFGVAKMGKIIGLEKLPQKFNNLKYCQRDTKIVYDFVYKMKEEFKQYKIPLKLTAPSTAFNYWKKNYWRKKIKRIEIKDLKYLHKAYYGGRCECFYIGKRTGKIRAYDVNSMYPGVMLNEYPYPFTFNHKPNLKTYGVTECLVESALARPILPFRTDTGKLIFPNGRFKGVWDNTELRFAVSKGVKIKKIYKGISYNYTCYPFYEYVKEIYQLRKQANNDYQKLIFKLMLNSLYGKFGQVNDGTRILSLYDFLSKKYRRFNDYEVFKDKIVIYREGKHYPVFCNMIWSLHTTALARIKLYQYIQELSDYGEILYCDTDSIFIAANNKTYINVSDKLGQLKLIGEYRQIEIVTNKFYRYGDIGIMLYKKIKGIPYANMSEFFKRRETTYKKPIRLREGLRRKLPINLWLNHTKRVKTSYDKGIVLATGRVKPLKIT